MTVTEEPWITQCLCEEYIRSNSTKDSLGQSESFLTVSKANIGLLIW